MPAPTTRIDLDIAIIGGGIAGLWLANRLKTQGFATALFEHRALGSDQTMASQGMVHGGMKYTLGGAFNNASESLADMPHYWRTCLCGEGDVDLRNTRLLSDYFYLWSTNSVTAKLSSFLASKALHGRVEPVPDKYCPPLLRHADFGGSLYRLEDVVLDVHSLVTNLAQNIDGQHFLIDWDALRWENNEDTLSLTLNHQGQDYAIHAQRIIFCAGKGNASLLEQLGAEGPAMQIRPLQQVMVKHTHPYSFFGHCLGGSTTPRLTISSHKLSTTEQVWYLGGTLAEQGANMSPEALIEFAQAELTELLPWVSFEDAEWKTLYIERAENRQPNFTRPESAFVDKAAGFSNLMVGWPTKLTLAPNLANQVLERLGADQIRPNTNQHGLTQLHALLPPAPIAATPWEQAFPPAITAEAALALRFSGPREEDD
jgi:hypothetical protein